MTIMRAVVRQHHDSALPEDDMINVWHFNTDVAGPSTSTDHADVFNRLQTFYQALDTYQSRLLGAQPTLTIYDLHDPEPRVPVYEANMTGMAYPSTGNPLPSECAICLSFHGVQVSGSPAARRRGRVYLGPWNDAALDPTGKIAGALLTAIDGAATALLASGTTEWAIYSRTDLPVVTDLDEGVTVVGGWIDNAWDTQRRRGEAPTSRTLF